MCLQVKRRGGFALFMSPWIKCMRGELATGTGVVGWRGKSRLVLARLTNSVRIYRIKKNKKTPSSGTMTSFLSAKV